MKDFVTAKVELVNSGELVFCPSCKRNKPVEDFHDSSLISGVGRNCMRCKGKPVKGGKITKRSKEINTQTSWSSKTCRVCETYLIEGGNWAPSRVKRHDYICGSCHGKTKRSGRAKKNPSKSKKTLPNCPKCGAILVKRYSPRYSKSFWGCPRYPACRGGRNL